MKSDEQKIRPETRREYEQCINKLTDYINQHLEEEMDLKSLAERSNLSPFHFHRIVKAFLKEPLGSYIGRLRLERAMRSLRYSNKTVQEIAFSVGYESPTSLSKVFHKTFGISPTDFRNNPNFIVMKKTDINTELNLKAPKIVEIPTKSVIYIRQSGNYSELDFGGTWAKLWAVVKEQKLFTAGIEHIALYHDDPNTTESEKLRTDICLVIHKTASPVGEIGVKTLPAGRFAQFLYQGSYDKLGNVYDTIFEKWLPDSGHLLRDACCFEKYISNPNITAPEKLKTEIYIPIG